MEHASFGNTGVFVSRLGLGCGGIGDARLTDGEAERVVLAAVDAGITFFDAARSYGLAEERLGRILASRRDAVVLSTKGGYMVDGAGDWTADAITRGIDDACTRLRTGCIDVFHLHSCPLDVLHRGDLLEALARAKQAGKIRVAAYSGDNEPLGWAVESGAFGSVQCSVNVFDQHALRGSVPHAAAKAMGVVAKRPLGNAPWRFESEPTRERMEALGLDPAPLSWEELAIRFAAFAPGVSCAVMGTTSVAHLLEAAAFLEKGALPSHVLAGISAKYEAVGLGWAGRI